MSYTVRWRLWSSVLGVAVAAALVAGVLGALGRHGGSGTDARDRVNARASIPSAIVRLVPGLRRGAEFDLKHTDIEGYDPSSGTLIGENSDEVLGVDGGNGRQRWRYRINTSSSEGSLLSSLGRYQRLPRWNAMAAGIVVIHRTWRKTGQTDLVGLAARTGDVRWRLRIPTDVEPVLSTRAVLLASTDAGILRTVDISTGRILWTASLPSGCRPWSYAGDPMTIVLELICHGQLELQILDPDDGALRAQKQLGEAPDEEDDPDELVVRDGIILIAKFDSFQLYASDGRLLVDRLNDGCWEYCDILVDGDTAVIAHSAQPSDDSDGAMEAIALADGSVRWRIALTAYYLIRDGGRLYAVGPAPEPVPLTAVYDIRTADGAATGVATEVPVDDIVLGGDTQPLFATSVTEKETYRLSRYSLTSTPGDVPGYLGGSDTAAWPDACAALTPANLGSIMPGPPVEPVDITRATAPPHSHCLYAPVRGKPVTVSVLWFARDEAAAARMFDRLTQNDLDLPVKVRGANEAVLNTRGGEGANIIDLRMRIGRTIASTAIADAKFGSEAVTTAQAKTAAAHVAANLLAHR